MAGKQLHVNFYEHFNLDALIHSALDEVQKRYRTDNLLENDDLGAIIVKKLPEDACYQMFRCNTCQKFVTCSKTGLKRHSTSTLHQKNVKATAGCSGTLTSLFTKAATRDESSSIEIKLCAFIAEHNLRIHYLKIL